MKIQVTQYDTTYTIEQEADDLTLTELFEIFETMAVALGFDQQMVDEYYGREGGDKNGDNMETDCIYGFEALDPDAAGCDSCSRGRTKNDDSGILQKGPDNR